MPDTTKTYDGKFSLPELNQTLVTQEQLTFQRLAALTAGNPNPPANEATFKDDPNPNPPPELTLVQVGPGQDLNTIIANQKAKGHKLQFSTTAFVSGKKTQVAIFR